MPPSSPPLVRAAAPASAYGSGRPGTGGRSAPDDPREAPAPPHMLRAVTLEAEMSLPIRYWPLRIEPTVTLGDTTGRALDHYVRLTRD